MAAMSSDDVYASIPEEGPNYVNSPHTTDKHVYNEPKNNPILSTAERLRCQIKVLAVIVVVAIVVILAVVVMVAVVIAGKDDELACQKFIFKEGESPGDLNSRVKELEASLNTDRRELSSLTARLQAAEEMNRQLVTQNTQLADQNNRLTIQMSKKDEGMGRQMDTMLNMMTDLTNSNNDAHAVLIPPTCTTVQSSDPRPVITLVNGMKVVCDTATDNGGWVVFQRRASAEIDFYRNWVEYKQGFGDMNGNFWLGLENIHRLSLNRQHELRVDFTFNGTEYFAHYDIFTVLGEQDNYKLLVSGYHGNSGDALKRHSGFSFTTKDRDNDASSENCAQLYHGAWWFNNCHEANLNGRWNDTNFGEGVIWYQTTTHYASASFTEIKMRPKQP